MLCCKISTCWPHCKDRQVSSLQRVLLALWCGMGLRKQVMVHCEELDLHVPVQGGACRADA